ncbi:hypothetical protein CPB84DRAFT_1750504 [Gymnopilus junonius]|uniref:Nephrocystin 3-like N-terminal domain-containing protein n=1 Tax=Gymnopilus junonius TaxID=109634 RepID=A0A9P5NDM4_GYMJU|nr:hypothetical protein CPB84DRAFT_1750504 [Gymnopilus junonius]
MHVGDLQAIKARLNKVIELFQVETQANIKLDTEMIKRNIEYKHNEYLENSRDDIIKDVSKWISNSKESVLWIYGPAGLGKSTVALQLIHLLKSDNHLAGGVFLQYLTNEHPNKMIQIIAKQLGKKHPQVIASVAEAVRKLDGTHDPIGKHMAAYLIDPICSLKYPYQLVIIIDGLDEWTNSKTFIAELINIPLNSPVKFVLMSHFNYSIEHILDKFLVCKYPFPPASQEIIEHYFLHHFEMNDIDWRGQKPDQSKMDERYPHIILDGILSSQERVATGNGEQLESLYHDALQSLSLPNVWGKHNVEEIHQCLVALQTQKDIKDKTIYPARQSLHASFLDFIQFFTPKSNGESFHSITPADGRNVPTQSFEIMNFMPSNTGLYILLMGLNKCHYRNQLAQFWQKYLMQSDNAGLLYISLTSYQAPYIPEALMRISQMFNCKEGNSMVKYHLSCLEVAVHLQGNDIETWIALAKGYQDLYSGISAWRQVLKLATMEDNHYSYSWVLNELADGLQSHFEQQGALRDLDEAISLN